MGRRPKQTILQRHIGGQKTHEKNVQNHSLLEKMQIKTTMRYHLTPGRMAIIKKVYKQISAGEGVGKKEPYYTGGILNWCNNC